MVDPPKKPAAPPDASDSGKPAAQPPASSLAARLSTDPWSVFALPLGVFMVVGSLEPIVARLFELAGVSAEDSAYPWVYLARIVFTIVAIALVWPGYRQFPWRLSLLAPLVGAIGAVIWIGLCKLGLEARVCEALGLDWLMDIGKRSAFNPLAHWSDQPAVAYAFLAVRFFGLAAVVPLIEEFFLRGLVMRYFLAHEWWKVPFGIVTPAAYLAGTLVPVLMHPTTELFAVVVWFTLVTWLMAKTQNMWDCVAAHAVTNGLLGAWVVYSGDWFLW